MKIKKGKLAVAIALIVITSVATVSLVLSQMITNWRVQIPHYQDIGVDEAYAYIYSGYRTLYPADILVLDVDEPVEFAQKHIAGAVNIPFMSGVLATTLSAPSHGILAGNETNMIIVTCMYGCRSPMASEMLWAAGFSYVYDMLGGIVMWNETAGYPAEPGATTVPSISVEQARIQLNGGICKTLVDVRLPSEYAVEHIVNSTTPPMVEAWNIPWYDPGNDLPVKLAGKEEDVIILYCQNDGCPKARLSCEKLVASGFKKVYRMIGGIDTWKKVGYPTMGTTQTTVFSDGFENGILPAWTGMGISTGETLQVVDTQAASGTYSCHAKCVTAKHKAYVYKDLAESDTIYLRMYVRFATDLVNGGSGIMLMNMMDGSNNAVITLRIRKTGGLYVLEVVNRGITYKSASFSISPPLVNNWHAVELQVHVDATAGWFNALWDSVNKVNYSGNTGTTMVQRVNVGIYYNWESNAEIYIDNVDVSNNPLP